MHPYQQPPQSRRRTGRTVFIIVAVVGVVCCLGLAGAGFGLYKILDKASEKPRAATHAFVADLAAGNTTAAYAKLCASTKGRYTQAQFDAVVQRDPKPRRVEIDGFDIENNNAEIRTVVHYVDGSSKMHTFSLVDESGWKICGDPY